MINHLLCITLQHTNVDIFLTLLQTQASLLGASLVFLGFIQVTLSNQEDKQQLSTRAFIDYLLSKGIIRRIRLLIVVTILGCLSSYIGTIFPIVILECVGGIFIILTLVLVGHLSFLVATHILSTATGQ